LKPFGAVLAVLASLAAALAAGACGYSNNLRVASRYPSVGIEIFGNDSFVRDIEVPLNNQMTLALRDISDARLVEPSRADAFVRGRVISYTRRAGIRSPDNLLLETGVRIEVEAELFKRGSLEPVRRARASSTVGYTTDNLDNENSARNTALHHVAEELILTLFAPEE